MKNAIIYYYNLKVNEVHQNTNYHWFEIDGETYYLYKMDNTNIDELLEIVNDLLKNNVRCHLPIPNKQNSILTNINGINYILLKIQVKSREPIIINDLYIINSIIVSKRDKKRPLWYDLWSEKIDYLELQISEFGKKYPTLRKSFPYFCGLAETAIQLLEIVDVKEYTINHKYITKDERLEDFLNPINMVIDLKTRDIAEYLKTNYNHITSIDDLKYIIKKFNLNKEEINRLEILQNSLPSKKANAKNTLANEVEPKLPQNREIVKNIIDEIKLSAKNNLIKSAISQFIDSRIPEINFYNKQFKNQNFSKAFAEELNCIFSIAFHKTDLKHDDTKWSNFFSKNLKNLDF